MRRPRALAVLLLVAACHLGAETDRVLEGRVVSLKDGDSFTLRLKEGGSLPPHLAEGPDVEIRIAFIDAPEHGQPWADRSRQALAGYILGRDLIVHPVGNDAYGRILGDVYADQICVGCELVRAGHAWVYRKYTNDRARYALEDEARAAKRGLWSLPAAQRVPPWEWRAAARERERAGAARPKSACDPPPSCDRVASCEEARRLLAQCGPAGLDGDGDGVPCERRCKLTD